MRVSIPLLLLAIVTVGCGTPELESELTIFHATDPQLFEQPAKQRPGEHDPEPASVRQFKENLNKTALAAFFDAIRAIPGSSPRVVVLTGDLGINRGWTDQAPAGKTDSNDKAAKAAPSAVAPGAFRHQRAEQVKRVVDLLKTSPVSDVYVIPGNDDLEIERAADEAIGHVNQFFQDVQNDLAGSRIALHNLGACYHAATPAPGGCVADLPGTSVRLVGFPSYSFKNATKEAYDANRTLQQAQTDKFASLVADARARDRKVIVLSHVADLDDPYVLARERFTGIAPDSHGNSQRPRASAWNVSPEVLARWKEQVESPTVLAVLAGHLHDSHKEIYRQPFAWSTSAPPDLRKLFLAPPLAVKLQENSPIQARGFSLLQLRGEQLSQQFRWFDTVSSKFEPEPSPRRPGGRTSQDSQLDLRGAVQWLWELGGTSLDPLQRLTVISVAFLLAFLTVARLWDVPKSATQLTGGVLEVPADTKAASPATPAQDTKAASPATPAQVDDSPLKTNLGKTVVSGISGLAAIAFLEPFFDKNGTAAKPYYVVWFTVLFFVLLFVVGFARGLLEACRLRIAADHRPPLWRPQPHLLPPETPYWRLWFWFKCCANWLRDRLVYWTRRAWAWVVSLRPPILVFFDTLSSVFFGVNLLRNAALADTISQLQLSMVIAVDRVRESITASVRHALVRALKEGQQPSEGDPGTLSLDSLEDSAVRVNISVLSPDGNSVLYISSGRGSLTQPFNRSSVAWVAVEGGEARWWKENYRNYDKIILHRNDNPKLENRGGVLYLRDYFQSRGSLDYKAFIVIPFPRRERDSAHSKGGIHISFSETKYFDMLWRGLAVSLPEEHTTDIPVYENAAHVLDRKVLRDDELRAVLYGSIDVLTELLRQFNMAVYYTYVKPRLLR